MGLKKWIQNKLIKRELKKMSPEKREEAEKKLEENPEYFEEINQEISEKKALGQDENIATMVLMKKKQQQMQNQMIKKNRKYKMK